MDHKNIKVAVLTSARLVLGWMFFWAFLDKTLGLGFATKAEDAWLNGGSPTAGFLGNAVHGPLAGIYHAMAGNGVVDILFMAGLGLVGLCLLLGIGLRVAGLSGALMALMMWSSLLPPENNPIVDEHILYAILFLGIAYSDAGLHYGLGKWWSHTSLVKRWPWMA